MSRPDVVVVGAGFARLSAAVRGEGKKNISELVGTKTDEWARR